MEIADKRVFMEMYAELQHYSPQPSLLSRVSMQASVRMSFWIPVIPTVVPDFVKTHTHTLIRRARLRRSEVVVFAAVAFR